MLVINRSTLALENHRSKSGWWFGTFFIFHNIWDSPSHWLSYFSRWLKHVKTTNQKWKFTIFQPAPQFGGIPQFQGPAVSSAQVTGTLFSMGCYTTVLSLFFRKSPRLKMVSASASSISLLLGLCIIMLGTVKLGQMWGVQKMGDPQSS